MNTTNIAIAKAYYKAMGEKNVEGMSAYLHPDLQVLSPLATFKEKRVYLESLKNFLPLFKSMTLRRIFSSEDQIMLAYDLDFPEPLGMFPVAVILTLKGGLITTLELFYDARPFDKKKDSYSVTN